MIDALTATRAYRRRLDFTRAVPRAEITACLDIAVCAPSGSNRQAWRFVVVEDPALRAGIAVHYRRGFEENLAGKAADGPDVASARYLADRLHEVPVHVVACQAGRPPAAPAKLASYYGSIYPAVWSFMVALRARGLGSVFTTAHLAYEWEVAELLRIPYDEVAQVALIPVGCLQRPEKLPVSRRSAQSSTYWNGWTR